MSELIETAPSPDPLGTDQEASRLSVLRVLASRPGLSQRDLARELGVSLGKTHYLLHALIDKGLLKAQNFKRSDNKVAYAYVLTPRGMNAKFRMTKNFLHRKEAEFDALKDTIASLRSELGRQSQGGHE